MFSSIAQSTYRRRFVLLGLIFFLMIPVPAYFAFKGLIFYLQNDEIQLLGVQYQRLIGALLNTSLRYEILVSQEKKGSERLSLRQEGFVYLKQIHALNKYSNRERCFPLGYGFSSKKLPSIDSFIWQKTWEELTTPKQETTQAASFTHFNEILADHLKRVGLNLSLFGNNNIVLFSLMFPTITQLVEMQLLVKNLTLARSKETINRNLYFWSHWEDLKKNEELTWRNYEEAFKEFRLQNPEKDLLQYHLQEKKVHYFESLNRFLDKITSEETPKEEILSASFDLLHMNQEFREAIFNATEKLLKIQIKQLKKMLWLYLLSLLLGIGGVLAYLFFGPLTGHMKKLRNHIEEISKGNFSPCFCSKDQDEFGEIGRTLDAMSQFIVKVACELHHLSRKLTEATLYLTQAAREQEFAVHGQEMQIINVENTSHEISQHQQQLAERTKAFNLETNQSFSLGKAKIILSDLQAKMAGFGEASSDIIALLTQVESKMKNLGGLITFMTKVSEGANLLSLNASIETANIIKNTESFAAISQKIQRFALNTSGATQDIDHIVDVMSKNMEGVKEEAVNCLKEINAGAQQLIELSNQLKKIAKQGNEQGEKFEKFAAIIEEQMSMTENMLQSIIELRKAAQNNTVTIQNLHHSLADLGNTASHLQSTLKMLGKYD